MEKVQLFIAAVPPRTIIWNVMMGLTCVSSYWCSIIMIPIM